MSVIICNGQSRKRSAKRTLILVLSALIMTSQSLLSSTYMICILLRKSIIVSSLPWQTEADAANPEPMHTRISADYDQELPTVDLDDKFIEIEGHTIGDEHRSVTSSNQFFNSIDTDQDGNLEKAELSKFLKDHIGGLTLDTDDEAKIEAEAILDRLDHNKDDKLDSKDIFKYWKSLESLLTVEEVAEWVVHSVQLPQEIGDIFRKNHVTGYDFPELVDKGGQALLDELNIEKQTFRKKIVRLVNARMLGIGHRPDTPSGIKIELEGCMTAIVKWKRTNAKGFPVHKYRVQRRRLGGDYDPLHRNSSKMTTAEEKFVNGRKVLSDPSNSKNDMCDSFNELGSDLVKYDDHHKTCSINDADSASCKSHPSSSSLKIALGWHTVYDGSLTEFHDFALQRGHRGYQYRIQAWNAVGKSNWAIVEMKQWGRKKCDRNMNHDSQESPGKSSLWSSFVNIMRSLSSVYWFLLVVTGGIIKLQRATLTSTAYKMEPIHIFVLKNINDSMKSVFGVDVVPSAFRKQSKDCDGKRNYSYERSVNQHKVAGFEQANSQRTTGRPKLPIGPSKTKINTSNKSLNDDANNDEQREGNKINKNQNLFKLMKSKSAQRLSSNFEAKPDKTDDLNHSTEARNDLPTLSLRLEAPDQNKSRVVIFEKNEDNKIQNTPPTTFNDDNTSSGDEVHETPRIIDSKCCVVCEKKFKMLGKRKKHHCAICYAPFCQQHGKTTHSSLVPCKVPGDCICSHCHSSIS